MAAALADLTETRACHCLAARRHARAVTRQYEDALRPVGLRATQFSVLAALEQMDATTLSPLADFLGVERTTLTRSAQLLAARGLVEEVGTADRRQRALRLTPAGRELLMTALPLWREVQAALDRSGTAVGQMARPGQDPHAVPLPTSSGATRGEQDE